MLAHHHVVLHACCNWYGVKDIKVLFIQKKITDLFISLSEGIKKYLSVHTKVVDGTTSFIECIKLFLIQ